MDKEISQKTVSPQALLRTILLLFFIPAAIVLGVFEIMRPLPREVRQDLAVVLRQLDVGDRREDLYGALPQGRFPHLGIHRLAYGHYHIGMQRPWYKHLWLNTLGGGIPTPYAKPYVDVKLKDEVVVSLQVVPD